MCSKKMLWLFLLLPLVLLFFAGCSSDEENPVAPTPKSDPPEFKLKEVSFPAKMASSSDNMAQKAITNANEAMSFAGTGCVFVAPAGAEALLESQTAWEYSWKDGGLTKKLGIALLSGQRKWQLFYTGTADGVSYSDWRYMDTAQKIDQSIGHVYVYKANTGQILQEWSWHTLTNKSYVFKKQNYADSATKVQITFEASGAGKIESYATGSAGSLVYDMLISWDATGNGTWRTYQGGSPLDTGTWN